MILLVPSRGRPQNIAELKEAVYSTAHGDVRFIVALDDDDPTVNEYTQIENVEFWVGTSKRLGPWLNELAPQLAKDDSVVGFMGDDHRPKSEGWDLRMIEAVGHKGIAYGNDLIQGPNLPTAVFMTSNIVEQLGYMCPPGLIHLFIDNAWLEWGRGAECLTYLDDVIIEHVHPLKGKAAQDVTYEAAWSYGNADAATWETYKESNLAHDIELIKEIL